MSKNIIVVISLLIAAGAIAFAVHASGKRNTLVKSLDEERYSRMVAEEASQKSAAKVATLENQLKQADTKVQRFKDILEEEKTVNSDLKKQYDKLVRVKADLESKLRGALEEKTAAAASQAAEAQNAVSGAGAQ